ncbi:MAG: LCP family protein [Patescibacteria group bacterium]|nr:LCP family protein [Patescibacteria group bacterium]
MTKTDLDFLSEKDKIIHAPKKKLKLIPKLIIYGLVVFVIFIIFFSITVITSGENLAQSLGNSSLWGQLKHLIGSNDKPLAGENEDRINILLLGMGGINHAGTYLSDTIILASFKPSTKEVALISIPRDLYVAIPGYGYGKINHANAYGELKNPGRGGELAREVVSNILDIPIQYYVRIDFDGFKKIIDDLGGITVDVDNVLNDYSYPIPGKETATTSERYEHLYIDKGEKHMDGTLALKYVRSRHGLGVEGSDFARSRRQQKVLTAVKEKALSFSTLANPYKISGILDTLSQHLATNLEPWQIIRLFNLGKDVKEDTIKRMVVDDSPGGYLYSTITEDGAFILLPRPGNYSEMRLGVKNIFDAEQAAKELPKKIEIQNGTKINGLAYTASQFLRKQGYEIVRTKNAPTQDYQKTVIYNLGGSANVETIKKISNLLKAEIASTLPSWLQATSTSTVTAQSDILIILGQDQKDI